MTLPVLPLSQGGIVQCQGRPSQIMISSKAESKSV